MFHEMTDTEGRRYVLYGKRGSYTLEKRDRLNRTLRMCNVPIPASIEDQDGEAIKRAEAHIRVDPQLTRDCLLACGLTDGRELVAEIRKLQKKEEG